MVSCCPHGFIQGQAAHIQTRNALTHPAKKTALSNLAFLDGRIRIYIYISSFEYELLLSLRKIRPNI